MKKTIHFLLSIILIGGLVFVESCKSDDPTPITYVLVAGNRTTGKFYSVTEATGATKEIFTPTFDGATLNEIRGFVYHPKKNLFYASQNSYPLSGGGSRLGKLFTINPTTKVATRINENNAVNGVIWDAIVNWSVAADDSLISVGDFNADGNGVVKFGTDGVRSKKTIKSNSICCGLGIIYDAKTNVFTTSPDGGYKNKVVIADLSGSTGVLSNQFDITTYTGFPEDLATASELYLRGMAKKADGSIFGVLFNNTVKKTYFVKIDLTAKSMKYISTIGADNTNQYNNLTYIPGNSF